MNDDIYYITNPVRTVTQHSKLNYLLLCHEPSSVCTHVVYILHSSLSEGNNFPISAWKLFFGISVMIEGLILNLSHGPSSQVFCKR